MRPMQGFPTRALVILPELLERADNGLSYWGHMPAITGSVVQIQLDNLHHPLSICLKQDLVTIVHATPYTGGCHNTSDAAPWNF